VLEIASPREYFSIWKGSFVGGAILGRRASAVIVLKREEFGRSGELCYNAKVQ
jgi:hypothetical protein